jgi:hypothetical protein
MNNVYKRHSLLVGGLLLLALAGCSQPAENKADVASLGKSGGSATSKSGGEAPASTDSKRPRLRLDMSNEESQRLYDAHTACLDKHDPKGTGKGAGPAGRKVYNEEAQTACLSKFPLPPWEMDADNPAFKDNWHKNVLCINGKGLKVIETEPGSWTYAGQSNLTSEEQAKIEADCAKEVFGGGGK